MSEPLRIFIGWDSREPIAYDVAKASALKHSSIPLEIVPIKLQDLVEQEPTREKSTPGVD